MRTLVATVFALGLAGTLTAAGGELVERFATYAEVSPSGTGVKLIGRWHGMSGKGWAVVETSDAKALYAWVAEWSEFLPLETTPVLEDADAGAVLGSIYK